MNFGVREARRAMVRIVCGCAHFPAYFAGVRECACGARHVRVRMCAGWDKQLGMLNALNTRLGHLVRNFGGECSNVFVA